MVSNLSWQPFGRCDGCASRRRVSQSAFGSGRMRSRVTPPTMGYVWTVDEALQEEMAVEIFLDSLPWPRLDSPLASVFHEAGRIGALSADRLIDPVG